MNDFVEVELLLAETADQVTCLVERYVADGGTVGVVVASAIGHLNDSLNGWLEREHGAGRDPEDLFPLGQVSFKLESLRRGLLAYQAGSR